MTDDQKRDIAKRITDEENNPWASAYYRTRMKVDAMRVVGFV